MKKKVLAVALTVIVLATVVGGTLAWFTDTDKVENTFTIGSIEIKVMEHFTKPDNMFPIVNTEDPASDPNFVTKEAWIRNTGKNPAYVQLFVAVPRALEDAGALHVLDGDKVGNDSDDDWTKSEKLGVVTIEDGTEWQKVDYNVYRYRYNHLLEAGAEANSYAIVGAYLDPALGYDGEAKRFTMNGEPFAAEIPTGGFNIYVLAQGVQAQGFDDAETALTEAFGTAVPDFN